MIVFLKHEFAQSLLNRSSIYTNQQIDYLFGKLDSYGTGIPPNQNFLISHFFPTSYSLENETWSKGLFKLFIRSFDHFSREHVSFEREKDVLILQSNAPILREILMIPFEFFHLILS